MSRRLGSWAGWHCSHGVRSLKWCFFGLSSVFWEGSHWRWCRASRNGVDERRGLCPVGPASCEDELGPYLWAAVWPRKCFRSSLGVIRGQSVTKFVES